MGFFKMGFFKGLISRLDIAKELIAFLWQRKLWWIIPIIIVLLLVGALIFFTQSSAVAPFIYTLF